jgi:hypothetical protein
MSSRYEIRAAVVRAKSSNMPKARETSPAPAFKYLLEQLRGM